MQSNKREQDEKLALYYFQTRVITPAQQITNKPFLILFVFVNPFAAVD
jgi:hypothetical protein